LAKGRVLHGQLIGNLVSDDRRLRIASPTKTAKSAEIGSMSRIRVDHGLFSVSRTISQPFPALLSARSVPDLVDQAFGTAELGPPGTFGIDHPLSTFVLAKNGTDGSLDVIGQAAGQARNRWHTRQRLNGV
jgi:hypothetical protein